MAMAKVNSEQCAITHIGSFDDVTQHTNAEGRGFGNSWDPKYSIYSRDCIITCHDYFDVYDDARSLRG